MGVERVSEDVMAAIKERNEIAEQIAVLRKQQSHVENRIHALLAEDVGATNVTMRYGATIVRISDVEATHALTADGQRKYASLLAHSPSLILRAINLSNPSRWAEMRAILDDYYPGGWEAFNRQNVEWGEKEAATSVKFIPEDKAPKFAQSLEDGQAIPR
jgi:hypothetical protein